MDTKIHEDELEQNKQERNGFRQRLAQAHKLDSNLATVERFLRNWYLIDDKSKDAECLASDYLHQIVLQLQELGNDDLLNFALLSKMKDDIITLLRGQRARLQSECEQVFAHNKSFYNGEL